MTITLITGGNKGLGREAARRLIGLGHTVYLGARDPGRGRAAAGGLGPGSCRSTSPTTRPWLARRARSPAARDGSTS